LLIRKSKLIALGLETGVSVPNGMSCSEDAFLRRRIRCLDDMIYQGYLEFTREFFLVFTLQSQKTDISVDGIFLHS
jgi:hypothetical protein